MPTTGVHNGHYMRLYVDGTAVAKATTCSLDMNMQTREIAHKDTSGAAGGYTEILPGKRSGTLSSDVLLAEGDSMTALFTAFNGGTQIAWKFSTEVAGDYRFTGNGYITALRLNAPDNENVTYTVEVAVDGAVTHEAVP